MARTDKDFTTVVVRSAPIAEVAARVGIPDSVLHNGEIEQTYDHALQTLFLTLRAQMLAGNRRDIEVTAEVSVDTPRRFRDWLMLGWIGLHEGYHPRFVAWLRRRVQWDTTSEFKRRGETVYERFCPHANTKFVPGGDHFEWLEAHDEVTT